MRTIRFFSILSVLLLMVVNIKAQEENKLYIPDMSADPGESFLLPVCIQNTSSKITGMQFDIELPEGLNVDFSNLGMTERTVNHKVRCLQKGQNLWTVMVYSNNNSVVNDNSGSVLTIPATLNDDVAVGTTIQMQLYRVVLSDSLGKNILTDKSCGSIEVTNSPDFVITDVESSLITIKPEDKFTINWKVQNIGRGASKGGWSERVSLISMDGDSILLESLSYNGILDAGGEISRSLDVELGRTLGLDGKGNIYIELIPNEDSGEKEHKRSNNEAESEKNALSIIRKLYVTLPSQVNEPENDSTIVLSVVRSGSCKKNLNISLSKQDGDRLILPENTFIPANSSEASFNLILKSDNIINDKLPAIVTIKADRYGTISKTIIIFDDDGPNLHVTKIDCSEFVSGSTAEVSWKVKNDGCVSTGDVEWTDHLWLLPEINGGTSMRGAVLLGDYENLSALRPNESYENRVVINVPERIYGNYDLVVMSDMADLRDIDFSSVGGEPPYPYEPSTSEYGYLRGKTSASSVKVKESGEGNDIFGYCYSDNFFYKRINIEVPRLPDVAVTKVVANIDTSDNGVPSPLSMAGLAGSSAFYSGKKVILTVTVINQGSADVDNTRISNRVYISHSEDNEDESLKLLDTQFTNISLNEGESKTITLTCQIPYEWSGDSWFHVNIDSSEDIYELANYANNWGHSDMAYVLLTPGADFKVRNLKVPTTITADLPFNISYSVNNIGAGVPYANTWNDRIYLSSSPNGLDESAILLNTYEQKGTYNIDGNGISVYSGDDYSVTRTIMAPNLTSGNYYLYVVVDADDDIFELEGEDNNMAISSPICCFVPDLISELINISSENLVLGGTSFFSWKLKNIGQGDIQKMSVTNSFYASSSEDGSDAYKIDQVIGTISIASGGELLMDGIVKIPNVDQLKGNKYVFVVTNTGNTIAEDNHDNNKSNSIGKIIEPSANLVITKVSFPASMKIGEMATVKISLMNASNFPISGDANVKVTLSARQTLEECTLHINNPTLSVDGLSVGESKDIDVLVSIPDNIKGGTNYAEIIVTPSVQTSADSKPTRILSEIYINGNLPDLTITSYNVPEKIETATPTEISWTISNIGDWDSKKSAYEMWLVDGINENKNIILAQGKLSEILKGEDAIVNSTIRIDDKNYGEKYIYITITENGEESNSDNNKLYIPVIIGQSQLPDLVMSKISVNGMLKNGEKITITAKVSNKGLGSTRAERWTDSFYLSTESEFNRYKATRLGSKLHVGSLSSEDSYEITVDVNIPIDAHGNYYLYGMVDATDLNYEDDEDNNFEGQKIYVEDKTDSPSQLVVRDLSVPSTIVAGETVTLSYIITNSGQFPANGTLRDIIYLSEDAQWDKDDQMVGFVSGTVDIASNTDLTREVKGRILNITEGSYYLIVKTNTTHNIIETNYDDNATVVSHPVKISFANLSSGTMSTIHTSGYYKLDVSGSTEGKTLGFYLSHDEEEPCGLYVSYGSVPSTAKYDLSSSALQVNQQEVLVPRVKNGTYYILAQANSAVSLNSNQFILSDESQDISDVKMTLSVKDIPFGATTLSVKEGGTEGWLSTEIHGAMLDSIMDFRLANADGEIPIEALTFHNQTYTIATFNLNRAETGSYDIISELPDGTQARMPNGFSVVPGMSVKLGVKLGLPAAVRGYVLAPISIAYANGGNTDIAIKELLVVAENGVLSKTVNGLKEAKSELSIVPEMGQDKRGYISIPPGTHEVINCFVGTSGNCNITVYVVK